MREGEGHIKRFALARPYGGDARDASRLVGHLTAILSIAAGVVHVSAAADHTNLPLMLVGFLAVAGLQFALGGLLLWRHPSGLMIAAALGLTVGSVGVWLASRTAGLPFLEGGHMEPIGFKDGVCVLFELGSVPGLLLLLSNDLRRVTLPSPRLATQSLAIVGTGVFVLMMPAVLLDGGEHHSQEDLAAHGHSHGEEVADTGSSVRHGHKEPSAGKRAGHSKRHANQGSSTGGHAHTGAQNEVLGQTHSHSGGGGGGANGRNDHSSGGHDDSGGGGNGGEKQHHPGRDEDDEKKHHPSGGDKGDHKNGHGNHDGGDPPPEDNEPPGLICISPDGDSICVP